MGLSSSHSPLQYNLHAWGCEARQRVILGGEGVSSPFLYPGLVWASAKWATVRGGGRLVETVTVFQKAAKKTARLQYRLETAILPTRDCYRLGTRAIDCTLPTRDCKKAWPESGHALRRSPLRGATRYQSPYLAALGVLHFGQRQHSRLFVLLGVRPGSPPFVFDLGSRGQAKPTGPPEWRVQGETESRWQGCGRFYDAGA